MVRKSQRGAGSGCAYRKNPKSLKKSKKSQRGAGGCHKKPSGQRGAGGCHKKPSGQRGAGGCAARKPAGQNAGGRGHGHGRHHKNTPKKLSRKRRTSLKRKSLVICGPEGCNSERK